MTEKHRYTCKECWSFSGTPPGETVGTCCRKKTLHAPECPACPDFDYYENQEWDDRAEQIKLDAQEYEPEEQEDEE